MKKALIDPRDNRFYQATGDAVPFPFAAPFTWIDCADDVTPETHNYNGSGFVPKPGTVPLTQEQKDARAQSSLSQAINKTIFDALWEVHQAVNRAVPLPNETKAAYAARLKAILAGYL